MNIIKRYINRYSKIDNKILRPIYFKNEQDLYLFLRDFILGRKLTITQYSDDDEGEGIIVDILGWDTGVVDIKLEEMSYFAIPAGNVSVKYYTNNDRSIFVYVPQESGYNGRYVFIIK